MVKSAITSCNSMHALGAALGKPLWFPLSHGVSWPLYKAS